MKALVTGGSGFLGAHIVDKLREKNYDVVVLDITELHRDDVKFIEGDIRNLDAIKEAAKGCEYIYHCAAVADIDAARKIPLKTIEVNVLGTTNCLEVAKEQNIKRFVLASSVYVSGNRGSFYRVSKQSSELISKVYNEEFGVPYTIVRYGSLYGRRANDWNFLRRVCKSLLTKREFVFYGSGEELREYINVEDAARETVRVAESDEFINKTVLITGHQRMKMKDFFEMIKEIMPFDVIIQYEGSEHPHYIITPYKYELDIPIRINMSEYIDIGEGILTVLKEVGNELGINSNNIP